MTRWRDALSACWDVLFQPGPTLARLAQTGDWRPAAAATALTSVLFALAAAASHGLGFELRDAPPLPLPDYRLWEAAGMPLLIAAGCCLGAGIGTGLGRLLYGRSDFRRLLLVLTPALLAPLWPMLWPTEMAVSLGVLDERLPGFPGLWVRELAPAFTVLYMLMLLVQAYWRIYQGSLREAFGLAVFSLVPVLGWWAYILR